MLHATGSKKELTRQAYYMLVADILEHADVQALKQFRHHHYTTRFQHSLNVSYYNYLLCRFFHWDAVSAARAGLLHDLYFYETADYDRSDSPDQKSHSAHHPEVAMQNAAVRFALNPRERDMIEKHMWPLTHRMPHYKESYAITFVDKYAAMLEFSGWCPAHAGTVSPEAFGEHGLKPEQLLEQHDTRELAVRG